MSLIELNDSIPDILAKMSAGNPGAINVLLQIYKEAPTIDPQDFMGSLGPILALDIHRIYGSDIWVFYKDICGQNIVDMCAVLRAVQLGIIPAVHVTNAISCAQKGRVDSDTTKLHIPTILDAVMERLEQFNRQPSAP